MAYAEKQSAARRPFVLSAVFGKKARTFGISLLSFLLLLLIWSAVTGAGLVKPIFLPGPQAVLNRLVKVAENGQLWADLSISLWRISIAFVLSAVMAIPGGIMLGVYEKLNTAVEPVIDFIRYMPVVAFVPLSILWFGTNEIQKYAIIWMGTFFQQILMVQDCVKRVPPDLIDVGRTLEMSRPKIMWRIILPAAAPGIWDALRITMGWAWSWLVLAELVAATNGLGYRITIAQRYLQTDLIIGYVLVLGFLGLITDQIMRRAEHRMFRYLRPRP